MRLVVHENNSLTLWLSANDTYEWARRWPGSTLSNRRLCATFESNGDLAELTINGRWDLDCDGHEFNAITSDFLAQRVPGHPAIKLPVEVEDKT